MTHEWRAKLQCLFAQQLALCAEGKEGTGNHSELMGGSDEQSQHS